MPWVLSPTLKTTGRATLSPRFWSSGCSGIWGCVLAKLPRRLFWCTTRSENQFEFYSQQILTLTFPFLGKELFGCFQHYGKMKKASSPTKARIIFTKYFFLAFLKNNIFMLLTEIVWWRSTGEFLIGLAEFLTSLANFGLMVCLIADGRRLVFI